MIDWFLPESVLEEQSDLERFQSRLIVMLGFFGYIPVLSYMGRGIPYSDGFKFCFALLIVTCTIGAFGFKVFKLRFRQVGLMISVGMTASLLLFSYLQQSSFQGTFYWYPVATMLTYYILGKTWGAAIGVIMFFASLITHFYFLDKGFDLPTFWTYDAWQADMFQDKMMSLFFSYMMVSFFYIAKERSEQNLMASQEIVFKQKEALFQKSHLAELGAVSGGVAHEINNPLLVIHGCNLKIKRMIDKGELSMESMIEITDKVERTVKRVSKIVTALQIYTRDGTSEPSGIFNLSIIYDELQEQFRTKFFQKKIVFTIGELSDASIEGVKEEVMKVFVHLLNNSYDSILAAPQRWIRVETLISPESIEVSVIDSGEGIPIDFEDKVFRPFFTTKAGAKGAGLGLSLSKELMTKHGGNLFVDKRHADSRVTLSFPRLAGHV